MEAWNVFAIASSCILEYFPFAVGYSPFLLKLQLLLMFLKTKMLLSNTYFAFQCFSSYESCITAMVG